MQITVMKKIPFCAGHRLVGHEGKCANLHGHNYIAEIYITGTEVDALGRIVDFAVINRLFKGWIDEHWDHGCLIWDQDVEAIDALRRIEPNRIYELPYNPTAENIARYLLTRVGPKLLEQIPEYDLQLSRVVVWETEKSSADISLISDSNIMTLASDSTATEMRQSF